MHSAGDERDQDSGIERVLYDRLFRTVLGDLRFEIAQVIVIKLFLADVFFPVVVGDIRRLFGTQRLQITLQFPLFLQPLLRRTKRKLRKQSMREMIVKSVIEEDIVFL